MAIIGAGAACGGTEEEPCRAPECLSALVQVALVDEAGDSVSARGELSSSDSPASWRFDCSADQSAPELGARCIDGSVSPRSMQLYSSTELQVRFEFADNSWGDGQPLAIDVTTRQVGEPGCSSPCLSATGSVVVPEGARLAEAGRQ